MKFIFVCLQRNETFESDNFHIADNKGVSEDESGNRVLDATVVLDEPCPFCGRKHVYHASELACPFNA